MTATRTEPAIDLTAFSCPHCHALAKQFWWRGYIRELGKDDTPGLVARDKSDVDFGDVPDEDLKRRLEAWAVKMAAGIPFQGEDREDPYSYALHNFNVSKCYNCEHLALWLYDRMIWPVRGNAPEANGDLPPEIRADYEEAATIADLSPRGAAALLRLALQKLCMHLGGSGENINADIGELVTKGLDRRVQQALDVVRVIGNNAVHPGQLDLRDDRATAGKLFALINLIADIMISQPKHINAMFDSLPDGAKRAIEKRDKKST